MAAELPPDLIRASDVDRRAVQERLHKAHADGLITLDEFDTRVGRVWEAKTRGELTELTKDLPESAPKRGRRRAPMELRVMGAIWLAASVVNLAIWGLVCLTTGQFIYPWWLWVVVPPGAVLGTVWWIFGRGDEKA